MPCELSPSKTKPRFVARNTFQCGVISDLMFFFVLFLFCSLFVFPSFGVRVVHAP